MSTTRNLALPLLAAAQAQKHVTHNEALARLDALVQIACLDKDRAEPPAGPAEGDRYLVAAPEPRGAWAGLSGQIALFEDGAWTGLPPRPGWLAYLVDEADLYIFTGSGWTSFRGTLTVLQNIARLGINTAADATNRLAVKAEGALLSWDEAGTGSTRLTVNKRGADRDAFLAFQTGFSSRALFGTFGSDDVALKVSADGAAFAPVLTASAATGRLALARIDAPLEVSGNAAGLPAAPASTLFRVSGADGGQCRVVLDAYGSAGNLIFRTAAGTAAAPAAVAAGTVLAGLSVFGYGATGYSGGARGQVNFAAAETWTDTAQGARVAFRTTPVGVLGSVETVSFEANGSIRLLPRAADPPDGAFGQMHANSTATALRWHTGTRWARLCNFAKFAAAVNFDGYVPAGAWTKVPFNLAESNDHGAFSAAGGRFTAPEAGLHRFDAALAYKRNGTSAPTQFEAQFYRNGAPAGRGRAAAGPPLDGVSTLALGATLDLAAGDTVEVFVRLAGGDGFVAAADSAFSGHQLP